MKCWLTLGALLVSVPLFSQVVIKPETARYYLEIEDEVFVLREKTDVLEELAYTQAEIIIKKDQIIHSYKQDSIIYQKREQAYEKSLQLAEDSLDQAHKDLNKQKLLKWVIVGIAVVVLIL